jgi:hypothetical protein
MPQLSDEQYRLVLQDAFERHIRWRLGRSETVAALEGVARIAGAPPGPPTVIDYRDALQIANLLGRRSEFDPPEVTVFQPEALARAEATLVRGFDGAKAELQQNGFLDALDENWPLILEYIRPEHLPEPDFDILRRLGDTDPGSGYML